MSASELQGRGDFVSASRIQGRGRFVPASEIQGRGATSHVSLRLKYTCFVLGLLGHFVIGSLVH